MKGLIFFIFFPLFLFAQDLPVEANYKQQTNSPIIADEKDEKPHKVTHAEPVFLDFISDLGGRKGEIGLDVGGGVMDHLSYYRFLSFVEFEFVPVHHLGFEIELPLTFYSEAGVPEVQNIDNDNEGNRFEGFSTAVQWTFLVSEKYKTSMALGYINQLKFPEFRNYGSKPLVTGNIYNPLFIVAKNFGGSYHTVLYTGPVFEHEFVDSNLDFTWQINTSFHYRISGTRNFLGIEFNQIIEEEGGFAMTVRPQININVSKKFSLGFVAGFPVSRDNERLSSFVRLIKIFI